MPLEELKEMDDKFASYMRTHEATIREPFKTYLINRISGFTFK